MILDEIVRYGHGQGAPFIGTHRHDLEAHDAAYGCPDPARDVALPASIAATGLSGRGGGHFPVAVKLASVLASGAATVVVNGAEGEPLARKDAALLQTRPHLVLDGAQSLARLLRAREVLVWLHAGADATIMSLQMACNERARDARFATDVPVRVMAGPARYLTGEGSAVISGVRGGPALPRFITNPAQPWVSGEPVVVHNAETHARIALLQRTSPQEYMATSLVTVHTAADLSVVDVPAWMSFARLFAHLGLPAPRLVLLGGYGGSWVRWSRLRDVCIDPAALKEAGLSLGAGIIRPLEPGESIMCVTAEILAYLADESAGQCGPCVFGLPTLAEQFARSARKSKLSSRWRGRVEDLFTAIEGRGACRHPDGSVRLARSALQELADAAP